MPCALLVLNLPKQVGIQPSVIALPWKGYRIPSGYPIPFIRVLAQTSLRASRTQQGSANHYHITIC